MEDCMLSDHTIPCKPDRGDQFFLQVSVFSLMQNENSENSPVKHVAKQTHFLQNIVLNY